MNVQTILREARRWARCRTPSERSEFWRLLAFERLLEMPVIFTDKFGIRYVLYPGQNAQVYFRSNGNYEVGETEYCRRSLAPGMTAIDVGANIGMYAMLFSQLVGASGHVHVFEPEDKNYERLSINLALNKCQNVTLNQAAVFSETKELTLNLFPDNISSWHSLGMPEMDDPWNPGQKIKPTRHVSVPGVSLDDYCARHAIDTIDLLKVDVEGAELEVFQGGRQMLESGRIRQIMFEISLPQIEGMGHAQNDIFSFLTGVAFQIRPIRADGSLGPAVSSTDLNYGNYIALRT